MTRLQETKSKLVEQSEDLAEVCLYLLDISLYLLSWTSTCSITDQVWNLPGPFVWFFRKADAFRVTWSEQVCLGSITEKHRLRRHGETPRRDSASKEHSDHFPYVKTSWTVRNKKKLLLSFFQMQIQRQVDLWRLVQSKVCDDCIVFCIGLILHLLLLKSWVFACSWLVFCHWFFTC